MQKKNETYRDKQLKKQRQLAKSKAKKQTEEGKKTDGNQERLFK